MDFGLLLFVAAFMIYTEMKSRQKKRRMQRRKENSPPKPQKRVIIKRKTPQTSSQKTRSEKEGDDAFDFEGFRKKIHIAWGTDDESAKAEKPHLEIDMSVKIGEEKPQEKVQPFKNTEPAGEMNAEETERFRRFQEAAKENARNPVQKTAAAFSAENVSADDTGREISSGANAMRQWVRYDAVFGAPRSRAGWRPKGMRKC